MYYLKLFYALFLAAAMKNFKHIQKKFKNTGFVLAV